MLIIFKAQQNPHHWGFKKRILSFCLILALTLLSMSGTTVFAAGGEEEPIPDGYIKVTFDTDGGVDVEPSFKIVDKTGGHMVHYRKQVKLGLYLWVGQR